jgi:alpha-amylase
VGNFGWVVEDHVENVYLPFLTTLAESELLPISLHVSGPVLEWLEDNGSEYLDLIGRLAADGQLELLMAGFYEPILSALPRPDRAEQLGRMREHLRRRFGVDASGLWLTERVWEPDLAADLADAGVRYTLVDDRHFLVSGFARDRLHVPLITEADGRSLTLFAIDERLRYLIPFRPPRETAKYLGALRAAGHRLAVFGDDGEKFGGWPGTRQWVFEKGWLRRYRRALTKLRENGELEPVTFSQALQRVPTAGPAYLPSASYREMEEWALPAPAALRMRGLDSPPPGDWHEPEPLIRGAHWRNFLVKYPEANRMHKKMLALSALSRERGDPPAVRQAIGRAQCNDAYWHGLFGGLYLPHLRHAVWRHLAAAERWLRRDEEIGFEVLDLDFDGHDEIWVHSDSFSAVVSPARGGTIEEYTLFDTGFNYADSLTRRRESYHESPPEQDSVGEELLKRELPPVDLDTRAMFVDRVLGPEVSRALYRKCRYAPVASWSRAAGVARARATAAGVTIAVYLPGQADDMDALSKEVHFDAGGELRVHYEWDPEAFPSASHFAPEISLGNDAELRCEPEAEVWSFPIRTVGRSERGLEETVQGMSCTPRWPITAGACQVTLVLP